MIPHYTAAYPPPPRRMVDPAVLARAIGWESRPKWVLRDGYYHLGPYRFPPDILDMPLELAVEAAKAACNLK